MKRRTFVALALASEVPLLTRHLLGVEARERKDFDVVVYGGVPCGIAAAIAAAREGARVLLAEPTSHIGGLTTSGINTAESEHMLKWTIGGISLEFYERLGKHYGTGQPEFFFESSVAEKIYGEMLDEAGVTIRFNSRLERVEKSEGKIRRIFFGDGTEAAAQVFIDAGYEGDLMSLAGVSCTWGRESREEFGEEAAGIRLDKNHRQAATTDELGQLLPGISAWGKDLVEGAAHKGVMNYNFRLCFTRDAEHKVPIPAPDTYNRGRYRLLENWFRKKSDEKVRVQLGELLDFYKRRNGKFEVNNRQNSIISLGHLGGQFDWPNASHARRTEIYGDHKDYTLGLLHFLANDESVPPNIRAEMKTWGLHREEFADNGNFPHQLYVREARRMRGVFTVTQRDVETDRHKPDSVGISSHFIDGHHVQRVALSPTSFVNEGRIWRIGYAYQIPYRSLVPQRAECANLIVPGAASFSHVSFCTYRLESVWMIGGHAAGVAAAAAAKRDIPVQDVDIPDLQASLRQQKQVIEFIPGKPEKFQGNINGPEEF